MKYLKTKLLSVCLPMILGVGLFSFSPSTSPVKAAVLDSDNYYSLLATAIDVSDTNTFENNKNPQIFDPTNEAFKSAVSARKDIDTYASSIQ